MNSECKFDVYHPSCPSRLFFENMADKWVLYILDTLKNQPHHFNSLKKMIVGISPKVLSQKLKMLERDGFILRTALNTRPIKIEYSLTDLGLEFAAHADKFKSWTENNMSRVLEAQQQYDVLQN